MPILHTLLSPQPNFLYHRLFAVAGAFISPFTPVTNELSPEDVVSYRGKISNVYAVRYSILLG